jgi:hypothetical protein
VVTIVRNFLPLTGNLNGFNNVDALRDIDILTVNIDGDVLDYASDLHGLN